MVSRTGAQLIDDAGNLLRDTLIPLASVVTPNRYEADIEWFRNSYTDDMRAAAQRIHQPGAKPC